MGPQPGPKRPDRAGQLALVRTLLLSALAPWLVYVLLRPHVKSAAEALAIGGSIPAAWVLARLVVRHRMEWLAAASVVVFAVAVTVSLLSGGSALPIELRSSVITGTIGLACLISVAIGRPLPLALARMRASGDTDRARAIEQVFTDPIRRHRLTVVTIMFGVTLLLDAAARAVLAVSLSTSTFLAVSGVTSWSIVGAGLALIVLYLRRRRS